MEFAEIHPSNDANPIDDEIMQEGTEKEACGLPTDKKSLNLSANAPFMLNIASLVQSVASSYCPIWKEIQNSANKDPTTLIEWLKRKKIEINRWGVNKNTVATHVTMNNGRFGIAEKDECDFLKWYAVSLTLSKRLWFVEQLTSVFRFFVDLDFAQLVGIPERHMEATAYVVQRAIRKFYLNFEEDDALVVIVCTTSYKYINAKNDKPELVKSGIHMIWPKLYVTRDDALNMRESILVELEECFGKRVHPNNSWQDVVDSSVYGTGNAGTKGSGLRMVGSRKTDPCNACKGKKTTRSPSGREDTCSHCLGNGRVDTGRPYFPLCVLNSYGKRAREKEEAYRVSMYSLIVDTKVRTSLRERPELPTFALPEHAPRHIAMDAFGKNRKGPVPNSVKQAKAGIMKPQDQSLQKSTRIEVNNTSAQWDAIEHLIRCAADGKYAKVVLSATTTNASGTQYIAHVTGEMCRYCMNVSREHVSNRIYFVIDAHGIVQRCHDAADCITDEMKFGLCKDYIGNLGTIPQALVSKLFPRCAAAKTLLDTMSTTLSDDENDEDHDFRITRDKKLRRLCEIGDALSKELFKMPWSSTLVTVHGSHIVARQTKAASDSKRAAIAVGDSKYLSCTEQYSIDPSALGSRFTIALRELGFSREIVPIPVATDSICSENGNDTRARVQSLSKLESRLFKQLASAIELVSFMTSEEAEVCLSHESFDAVIETRHIPRKIEKSRNIRDLTSQY